MPTYQQKVAQIPNTNTCVISHITFNCAVRSLSSSNSIFVDDFHKSLKRFFSNKLYEQLKMKYEGRRNGVANIFFNALFTINQ